MHVTHSCMLPMHSCMLPMHSCMLPMHSCMLPMHSCMLPTRACYPLVHVTHSCMLPMHSCMLPMHSCMLPTHACYQGRIQGGATGGCSPPLSSSDHTPYLHEYRTYSGISNKEVERKLSAGLFPTETAFDSQNESDTESTRAGDENGSQGSDHVHGESLSDLTLIGDS